MTNHEEIEAIKKSALEFSKVLRAIVIDMPEDKILQTLPLGGQGKTCFPNGGCRAASNLFGHFLLERGIVKKIYQCTYEFIGDRGIEHTWLEYGNCIIDLTCCQYDGSLDVPPCPYKCPLVSDSDRDWYSTNWPSEFRQCQNVSEITLHVRYREILDNIKKAI